MFFSSILSFLFFSCSDQEKSSSPQVETEKPSQVQLSSNRNNSSIQLTELEGALDIEFTQIDLFDSKIHRFARSIDVDVSKPGPRLLAIGKIKNNTNEFITNGGIYANLKVCMEEVCEEKSSHDRGFLLPLTDENPWRPGEWRQFVTVSRPHKSFLRELSPSTVEGSLRIDLSGVSKVNIKNQIWKEPLEWSHLGGMVFNAHFTLKKKRRINQKRYAIGTSFEVLAKSGMDVAVQESGKWMWVNMMSVPEVYEAVGQNVPTTTLPSVHSTEDLTVKIHKLHFTEEQDEVTDRVSRYLVVEVELVGRKERGVRMKWKNFNLLTGDLEVVAPEKEPEFIKKPLTKDKIPYGEIRKGQLAFPCPHGVHPLRIRIKFDRTKTVNIPLTNLSALLTEE